MGDKVLDGRWPCLHCGENARSVKVGGAMADSRRERTQWGDADVWSALRCPEGGDRKLARTRDTRST